MPIIDQTTADDWQYCAGSTEVIRLTGRMLLRPEFHKHGLLTIRTFALWLGVRARMQLMV